MSLGVVCHVQDRPSVPDCEVECAHFCISLHTETKSETCIEVKLTHVGNSQTRHIYEDNQVVITFQYSSLFQLYL